MIDIHSHILPGIDDGAKNEEQSLKMAKAAIEQGIHTIIATPHHQNGAFNNFRWEIENNVEILNDFFKREGVPLTVLPGQETRIYGEMVEGLRQNELLPLNYSKYVFVEFPSDSVPRYTTQLLFDIQVEGYTPIIVHPERNRSLLEHPNLLYELVSKGALTQVTAGSVVGKFGKDIQKFTTQIIEANLTHFVASDAHNTTSRAFYLQEAYEDIKKNFGSDYFYMFLENSNLLVDNDHVNCLEPLRVKQKKKFLGLF
ncbi:tyrosine protein phosphatase [Virgibacillus pantothenticus]|uniref:Tyrosine-protein phosphatase n=1 Tax=Virgibacillus pantothenticus TaxID=1473 RepID=A0A0L0QJH4_VIRPA|nr:MULTISPECIES: CpsB/CapC family capsule biosynthesis tyrosine phosphatase [Virgibacillus]API92965.1 tyrosine protein phosphatase [Virgibacillus sp. 6R]KNE18800.1 tyrosine protein phosphatase [Virgibacillus pantothenticus]MBS7428489.1 tyrosine protein phosphatase [Virgibacillus sp. 19R1-5]MED3738477.1 tyrosine protein phosphatase [Virgibacillus pantothenticus]QTY15224.1 tyrosine protein phosphatase [Virgibacillus pantothenticus]